MATIQIIRGGIGQSFGRIIIPNFGADMIYSFIIITCSLMIYFATKELYALSKHKGIKYFRMSFLFFAIAYGFRSFIKFLLSYFNVARVLDIYPGTLYFGAGKLTLFVFMYFSSMSIFYLIYSVMSKKWESKEDMIYILHGLALTIATMSMVLTNPIVYLGLNILLLVLIITAFNLSKHNNRKSKQSLHFIYTLMSVFWAINVIDILIPSFFEGLQLLMYLASSGIFLAMLYKVARKLGAS